MVEQRKADDDDEENRNRPLESREFTGRIPHTCELVHMSEGGDDQPTEGWAEVYGVADARA